MLEYIFMSLPKSMLYLYTYLTHTLVTLTLNSFVFIGNTLTLSHIHTLKHKELYIKNI